MLILPERFFRSDAAAFRNGQDLIRFDVLQTIDHAAGPEDFETLGHSRTPQAKMNAQVVLSLVAGSRLDVTQQNLSIHGQFQTRADAIPIAFRTYRADQKSVAAVPSIIAKQVRRLAVIADQDIEITIVVQVSHRQRAADFLQCESRAGS